jgi:Flp pilus assembly protein TadG
VHRTRRSEKGQDLIEFALLLPLLLLLLTGIMEFGLAVMAYNTIANAAREGARYGIIHPADDAAIEARARELTTGLDQDELDVAVARPVAGTIQVDVTYLHHFVTTPIIVTVGGDGTLTMHTVSTMNIE